MTLLAFAAERRAVAPLLLGALDRDLLLAGRSAANPPPAVERWYRRTDGWTDTRPSCTPGADPEFALGGVPLPCPPFLSPLEVGSP